MIAATGFSLLFVPSFFVVFQSLSEFWKDQDPDTTPDDVSEAKDDQEKKPDPDQGNSEIDDKAS